VYIPLSDYPHNRRFPLSDCRSVRPNEEFGGEFHFSRGNTLCVTESLGKSTSFASRAVHCTFWHSKFTRSAHNTFRVQGIRKFVLEWKERICGAVFQNKYVIIGIFPNALVIAILPVLEFQRHTHHTGSAIWKIMLYQHLQLVK